MTSDWDCNADKWIANMGERGDWSRECILDPAMLARVAQHPCRTALDVGCGEGRFCRLLRTNGIETVGIDPTATLIGEARCRDPEGQYLIGKAERLEFDDDHFDLVVSYLTLIDIPDFRAAIREMARVLKPAGVLLVANVSSLFSSGFGQGWVADDHGRRRYTIDRYLEEFSQQVRFSGIEIENWHRPLGAYMTAFFDNGLALRFFQEPEPTGGDPLRVDMYRRAPWFVVMEWTKPIQV